MLRRRLDKLSDTTFVVLRVDSAAACADVRSSYMAVPNLLIKLAMQIQT